MISKLWFCWELSSRIVVYRDRILGRGVGSNSCNRRRRSLSVGCFLLCPDFLYTAQWPVSLTMRHLATEGIRLTCVWFSRLLDSTTHGKAGVVCVFRPARQDRPTSGRAYLPFYFFSTRRRQKEAVPWMDVPCRLGVATSHHMQLPARRWSRATHLRACSLGKLQPPTKLSLG